MSGQNEQEKQEKKEVNEKLSQTIPKEEKKRKEKNRTEQNRTKQNKTKQNKTKQNKTKKKTNHDRDRFNSPLENWEIHLVLMNCTELVGDIITAQWSSWILVVGVLERSKAEWNYNHAMQKKKKKKKKKKDS